MDEEFVSRGPELKFYDHTKERSNALKPKGYVPTIQEHTRERVSNVIGDLEAMLDNKECTPGEFSLYQWLGKISASTAVAQGIMDHYGPCAEELLLVLAGGEGDEQLVEGYSRYDQDELIEKAMIYQGFLDDVTRFLDTTKKLRKIRKKKTVSVEKLIKNFVFAKENTDLQLASIDPAGILKAQELWAYNPKSQELTVFRAVDRGGLTIERTAIKNYDIKTSLTKKLPKRKVKEILDTVLSGGKVALRKVMDGANTEAKRITKTTILLKVVR